MPRAATSDTRSRLMQAARRRFAADGAIAATLDEIRRDAEVSVGALYHHFPDKPALAAAVYAQVMSEYQGSFVAMLRRQQTAEDGIRGGVAHHLRWVAANRGEAALLLGDRLEQRGVARSQHGRSSPPCGTGGDRTTPTERCVRCRPASPPRCGSARRRNSAGIGLPAMNPDATRRAIKTFADAAWKTLRVNVIEEDE